MREAVGNGKTVEEAIAAALEDLKIAREDADITVLELPTRGLLGILPGKEAKVHVRELFDPILFASDWMEKLLENMHVNARVHVQEQDQRICIDIQGQNLGALIGRKGQTLDALQYLTTLALNKKCSDFMPVLVDAGDYRKNRQQSIEKNALSAADRVLRTGRKIALGPMNAAERRYVHMALSGKSGIATYSVGEEPRRKVVVDIEDGE